MINIKQMILDEVRYIDPDFYKMDNESPIMDNETIRVYHGFASMDDAERVLERGISGKVRANRRHSYEFRNNPKGVFVSIDLNVAKEFGGSGVIIEFTSKVSDLESPVWKGGKFFVQGEYTKQFDDDDDREAERTTRRKDTDTSDDPKISGSSRSELADSIFNNSEKQALFIGDLNPNMIKAVWYNKVLDEDRRTNGKWERMSRKEFIKMKDISPLPPYEQQDGFRGKFRPADDFTFKNFLINGEYPVDFLESLFDGSIDINRTGEGWAGSFYPKQLNQVFDIIDSDKAEKVMDMMKSGVDYKDIDKFVKE